MNILESRKEADVWTFRLRMARTTVVHKVAFLMLHGAKLFRVCNADIPVISEVNCKQ